MPQTVECFYTLSSPWAYFAGPRLQAIIARHQARLVLRPFDFREVVPETGGIPLRTRPEPRQRYHALELARFRDVLGMPLNLAPRHYPPSDQRPAGRLVMAAQARGLDALRLSHALLRALWVEEQDIALPETRVAIADAEGMPGSELLAAEESTEILAAWAFNNADAVRFGVFGSPTFIHDGVPYWGQDRLDFLDRALDRAR